LAALLLFAGSARAETWRITPSISATETYTTNVNFSASGQEQSSFVTSVMPRVAVTGTGARVNLNAFASVGVNVYAGGTSDTTVYPTLGLLGKVEAIEKTFYVEGAAYVSQTYISPFGPQPVGTIGITNNRYTSAGYRLSPYFQGVLPGSYTYLLRNDSIWTGAYNTSGGANLSGSYTNSTVGRLASPVALFGWAVDGTATSLKYNTAPNTLTNQLVRATLYFQPDPQVRLSADGGYEWNNYAFTDRSNSIYGAGVQWRPTDRTVVEGNWEERFFGSSYLARFTHRMPFIAWDIGASRNIATYPQLINAPATIGNLEALFDASLTTRIPDPVQRAQAVQALLAQSNVPALLQTPLNYYVQQVTLQERQYATMTLLGVRNTLGFTIYNVRSEAISGAGNPLPAPFSAAINNRQQGAAAVLSHQLSGTTSLSATAGRYNTHALAPSTAETTQTYVQLGATHQFSPKTTSFAGASYTWSATNVSNDFATLNAYVGVNHNF
jgi:uncharacterized protein (PEP-CTERM system associated)